MQRREFITLVAGMATTWPVAARAQRPEGRVYRVGFLSLAEKQYFATKAFEEGLRSLGYRVGENVVIEYRFANGRIERLLGLAADLVRLGVDIIVTGTNEITLAAMKATPTIPIVMSVGIDPVSDGLAASLARPGGNVTGLAVDAGNAILGKRFDMLKEMLPNLSRLAIMFNPDMAVNRVRLTSMTEIARALGLTTIPVEAHGLDALEQAFATMVKERAQALVMQGDSVLFNHRSQIVEMALQNRLPTASVSKELAEAGFLLTYGADIGDLYRRAAFFVDKIFNCANPADLPLEQPTKFELVINLKTAKALGLTVPRSILLRADEVIE